VNFHENSNGDVYISAIKKEKIHFVIQIFYEERGNQTMTVGTQVQQTIAGLKSAQASFETFALGTENEAAKQLYKDAAKQTQAIIDSVEPRLQQILQEEPQYNQ
jgi:Protein of unknown function (DUF1657)